MTTVIDAFEVVMVVLIEAVDESHIVPVAIRYMAEFPVELSVAGVFGLAKFHDQTCFGKGLEIAIFEPKEREAINLGPVPRYGLKVLPADQAQPLSVEAQAVKSIEINGVRNPIVD